MATRSDRMHETAITARPIHDTVVSLILTTGLLSMPLATTVAASTPVFVASFNPLGIADVGHLAKPSSADLDGDGDPDLLVGNLDGDLVFLENIGSAAAPAFAPPVANPFGLTRTGQFSAPVLIDLDDDDDPDLLVGDSKGDLIFFENVGTAATPAFAPGTTNPFGLIDSGNDSVPTSGDIDGDGDLDLMVGSRSGDIAFFSNVGTAGLPAFELVAVNPFGLTDVVRDAAPSLGDVDGDGDLDLLVGSGLGAGVGILDLHFFENIGTASTAMFAASTQSPFGLDAAAGAHPGPVFVDLDDDGDLDLVIGEGIGTSHYFENAPVATETAFAAPVVNPFGLTRVGTAFVGGAAPELGDIDDDGDLDAFIGSLEGNTVFFANTGTASAPVFAAAVQNPFGLIDVGTLAAPRLVDIDDDGDLDAFVGNGSGLTQFFENTGTKSAPAFAAGVQNPFGLGSVGDTARPDFADIDDDGDLDAFIGSESDDTFLFENTGTRSVPAFAVGVQSPFGLTAVGDTAAPRLADIDDDGDLDAFVGNARGNTRFFENTGTPAAPSFAAAVQNPLGLADVGSDATPALADVDGDGDLDAFVGNAVGDTLYFENVGKLVPAFEIVPPNPFGVANIGAAAEPALVDIDDDGDLDLFVGTPVGNIFFLENVGTSISPVFGAPTLMGNSGGISRAFADIDDDGDMDLFLLHGQGEVVFQRNLGTPQAPEFSALGDVDPFGLSDMNGSAIDFADMDDDGDLDFLVSVKPGGVALLENVGTRSAPAFDPTPTYLGTEAGAPVAEDLDGDHDVDLLVAVGSDLLYYENGGTPAVPDFPTVMSNPFGLTSIPHFGRLARGDIDGDGDLDLIAGSLFGDLFFFENAGLVPCPSLLEPSCTTGFAKAQLVVNEKRAGKERLVAKLLRGPALGQTDFGDPLVAGGTALALCLYDDQGERVGAMTVDRAGDLCGQKPCWKHIGGEPPTGRGYSYRDRAAGSSGVAMIRLKGGAVEKSSVLVRAKNDAARGLSALPTELVGALSGTSRIEMQIRTSESRCFAATLDEITEKNGVLKAK